MLFDADVFLSAKEEGLALFYVLVMMSAGGRDMRIFLFPLAVTLLFACCLTGCLSEDRLDDVKIDGSMAVAWSGGLEFTVERSGKSLLGSAVSGEGLVNVFRGTGKVLMAPVDKV